MGTKRKFWFSREGQPWLFKAEERGTGEDWAEKIVCELARLLGLPHVEYELAAEYEGNVYLQPGVICPHCAPPPLNLAHGNQLLLARDPTYPGGTGRRYKVKEYTVDAVTHCMEALGAPPSGWMAGIPEWIATALDVFVGYILLATYCWTHGQPIRIGTMKIGVPFAFPMIQRFGWRRPSTMGRHWRGIFPMRSAKIGLKAGTGAGKSGLSPHGRVPASTEQRVRTAR